MAEQGGAGRAFRQAALLVAPRVERQLVVGQVQLFERVHGLEHGARSGQQVGVGGELQRLAGDAGGQRRAGRQLGRIAGQ